MAASATDMRAAIRQVLAEETNKRRAEANRLNIPGVVDPVSGYTAGSSGSTGNPAAGMNASPDDRFRALRDRIATLEDVLVKSEADRQAVYERCEAATSALNSLNEEREGLIRALHQATSTGANAVELEAAQREVVSLRQQLSATQERLEDTTRRAEEAEKQAKQLKKEKKRILAETDGVSLADLHYSNERLSAQLIELQRQQQRQDTDVKARDANRIAELDLAVRTLTTELGVVEQRVVATRDAHESEKRRLQDELDRQYRDFAVERAECDAVVHAMGAKMETMRLRIDALTNENATLKQQLAASQPPERERMTHAHSGAIRAKR